MALSTIGTNGIADSAVTIAKSSGLGKVINVYQDYITGQVETSSDNSYVDVTGLAITLTPASVTSKFWLHFSTTGSNISGAAQAINFSLDFKRAITGGTTTASIINATNSGGYNIRYNYDNRSDDLAGINYLNPAMSISWLDDPDTASEITYTCQMNKYQWAGTSGETMGVTGGMFQILEVAS